VTRPARAAALALVVAAAGLLAGCGVRATPVPVDAGAAPTRVACALPSPRSTGDAFGTTTMRVYLVCGQRLSPVEREVRDRRSSRVATARLLLDELEREPDGAEARAGFASEVPIGLGVSGPAHGDPPDALRLGQDPRELPSYAVGQVVCTFADALEGAAGDPVVLGGPDSATAPRRYVCDDALRGDPDAGPTAGVPLS
jgi:hypothetical protein